jgi:hypothetical protein
MRAPGPERGSFRSGRRDITCDPVGACGSVMVLGGAAERRTSRADFLTHRGHPLYHGDRGALQTGPAREDHPGATVSNTAAVRPLGSSHVLRLEPRSFRPGRAFRSRGP